MDQFLEELFIWTYIGVIFFLVVVFAACLVLWIEKSGTYDDKQD